MLVLARYFLSPFSGLRSVTHSLHSSHFCTFSLYIAASCVQLHGHTNLHALSSLCSFLSLHFFPKSCMSSSPQGDLEKFKLGAFISYIHVVLSYPSVLATIHAYNSVTYPYNKVIDSKEAGSHVRVHRPQNSSSSFLLLSNLLLPPFYFNHITLSCFPQIDSVFPFRSNL